MFRSRHTKIEFFGGSHDGRVLTFPDDKIRPIFVLLRSEGDRITEERYLLLVDLVLNKARPRTIYVFQDAVTNWKEVWNHQGGLPDDQRTR